MNPILQFFQDLDKIFRVALSNQQAVKELQDRIVIIEGADQTKVNEIENNIESLRRETVGLRSQLTEIVAQMQKIADTEYIEA